MQNFTVKSVNSEEAKSAQEKEQAVVEAAAKKTPNVEVEKSGTIKVDLDNPPEPKKDIPTPEAVVDKPKEPVEESEVRASDLGDVHQEEEKPKEAVVEAAEKVAPPAIEKIEDVEPVKVKVAPPVEVPTTPQAQNLPEGVDKLVAFLDETGGTLEDYVNLNKDVDKMDEIDIIKEYYRQKNPQMSADRLARKMDKQFLFDEDLDDADVIQDKKDLFEDELYVAKKGLQSNREKYYSDLKLRKHDNLPEEVKQAVVAYNQQKQVAEETQKITKVFLDRTEQVFNEDFKGFEFKLGQEKFRVNVSEAEKVKTEQSDLTNFISKFVGKDGSIEDAVGYHKALFAANNVDKLANHFYEQGRADAVKQNSADAKNIDMSARQVAPGTIQSGPKVRVLANESSDKLRIKTRK